MTAYIRNRTPSIIRKSRPKPTEEAMRKFVSGMAVTQYEAVRHAESERTGLLYPGAPDFPRWYGKTFLEVAGRKRYGAMGIASPAEIRAKARGHNKRYYEDHRRVWAEETGKQWQRAKNFVALYGRTYEEIVNVDERILEAPYADLADVRRMVGAARTDMVYRRIRGELERLTGKRWPIPADFKRVYAVRFG